MAPPVGCPTLVVKKEQIVICVALSFDISHAYSSILLELAFTMQIRADTDLAPRQDNK